MSKHKILFASSLKPAFDIRTEKLFLSFQDENKYVCHFCGVKSKGHHNIHSWKYNRGLFFRIWINLRFIFLLIRLRPQTIFLNNTDLQSVAIIYKSISSTQLIFDFQENQINNISYQKIYSGLKKKLLLFYTHLVYKSLNKHCSGFILAENCYKEQLSFIRKKPFIILENRTLPTQYQRTQKEVHPPIQLLLSGTISITSGVLNAINWCNEINKISSCELMITGHCPDKNLHLELISKSQQNTKINYQGSLTPINHRLIEKAISISDFGLICYELTEANKDKTPTKLYEYLAAQLPIICQTHKQWNDLISIYNAGIKYPDLKNLDQLQANFYANKSTDFTLWDKQLLTEWFVKLCIK